MRQFVIPHVTNELGILSSIHISGLNSKTPINTSTEYSLFPYATNSVIGLEQTPANIPSVIKTLVFLLHLAHDDEFDTIDSARDVNNLSFITHELLLVICFLRPLGSVLVVVYSA